jgi:hypothetical protein
VLKGEAAENAARLAWQGIERRARSKTISLAAGRALLAEISSFEERHGTTRFAASASVKIAALRARAEQATVPMLGLVGHWTFDEGRGRVAADASANANHGRLEGGEGAGRGPAGSKARSAEPWP